VYLRCLIFLFLIRLTLPNESVLEVDEIGGYAKIIKTAKKSPLDPISQRSTTLGRESKRPVMPNHTSSTLPRKPELPITPNVKQLLATKASPSVSFVCEIWGT
jgi:hypothetical protein